MNTDLIVVLLVGFAGGILGELLALSAEVKQRKRLVSTRRGKALWITLPIDGFIGMFVTWVYTTTQGTMHPVIALQIGASAPLILQRMAVAIGPLQNPDDDEPNFALLRSKSPSTLESIRRHLALGEM